MSAEQRTTDNGQGTRGTGLVLPYRVGDGPANMALDEAMLEAAAREGSAYLRFYGWAEPTLSLGYFQRLAEVRSDPRWEGRPIVRRPTGGGAIWHHHELTYAIAIPPHSPLVRPNTALYRAVHGAIAAVLADRGIPARRRGEPSTLHLPASTRPDNRPLLCFTGCDPEDIVWEGHKLVGSAQRRRGGAVLQHGSILLARSPGVPELLGVCDVAELSPSPEEWEVSFRLGLIEALGLEPVDAGVPGPLRARASELERSVYRDPAWTALR
jgi:lipoate-protein ligase A